MRAGVVIAMVVCPVLLLGGCEQPAAEAEAFVSVPQEVEGWQSAAPDETYDRETLFKYIDGAAEVYLAYGFRRVLARRYTKSDEAPIALDVFDMGSSEDAFGVFAFERDGPDVGIGQGADYGGGLLLFWKHRFFVSILAAPETPARRKAVLSLGKAVADAIPQSGRVPDLIGLLPPEGLRAERVVYLHTEGSLAYHYFIAEDNILKLGRDTQAALAQYGPKEKRYRLLLVKYPRESRAKKALASFLPSYLPEAGADGAARVEDGGWCAAQRHGSHVIVVFQAPEKPAATGLLAATRARLREAEGK